MTRHTTGPYPQSSGEGSQFVETSISVQKRRRGMQKLFSCENKPFLEQYELMVSYPPLILLLE